MLITLFIDFEQVFAHWVHAHILPFVRASFTQSNKILFFPLFRLMITWACSIVASKTQFSELSG